MCAKFIAVFSFLIEILQWKVLHHNYSNVRLYVTGSSGNFIRLAESSNNFGSGSGINPYQFEPVHATGYSDSEDDSSESETIGKLH